jgi:hypothetical protein
MPINHLSSICPAAVSRVGGENDNIHSTQKPPEVFLGRSSTKPASAPAYSCLSSARHAANRCGEALAARFAMEQEPALRGRWRDRWKATGEKATLG